MKTNSLFAFIFLFSVLVSCSKTIDNTGTCSDGIQNQDEQGVDCGGPCGNPCVSCGDGIRNQGESAVDCGGPCDPCYKRLSAVINGVVWNSQSRNAFISAPGTLRIYGTNTMKNITLIYSGPFIPGSVASGAQFTGELRDENGTVYTSVQGGAISFSAFDTTTRTISGTYRFIGSSSSGGASVIVSNGIFNVLEY